MTYGVEAARSAISRQIEEVFAVYGIGVNPRHLGLLADYMTQGGGYSPLNRSGMEERKMDSPFLQMTFETTMNFLTRAATHAERDEVDSPAGRIVVGRPPAVGTGSFQLVQPLSM